MKIQRATVFGGSGFLGRHIVKRLARAGVRIRVAVRDPEGAWFLRPNGAEGQIVPVYGNVTEPASVEAAVEGVDAVFNCVSLYVERGQATFERVHVDGARTVAEAAKAAGVKRLLHTSGIGSRPDHPSKYASARGRGDEAVAAAFPGATFVSPSVMFGPGDSFFNTLASMARFSPVMPLFGGGKTKLQPVYVGDVADTFMAVLERRGAEGATYELGGPRVYTYRELMEVLLAELNRDKIMLPVPFGLAEFMATFMTLLPNPPLTRDQVKLLREDNVVSGENALDTLGIAPHAVELILPTYMDMYRKGGRWGRKARMI